MSTPGDDELLDAYREASAAEAGQPSPATRAAVLAHARAQLSREGAARPRAANDARFAWRMVAGLAMVGVGLLIWRQLPREATERVTTETPTARVATPAPAAAPADPAAQLRTQPEPPPPPPAQSQSQAEFVRERAEGMSAARELQAAKAAPPVVVDLQMRQAVPESAEAVQSFGGSVAALVRREFPTLADDPMPPAGVWIVQDGQGRTLRTGTLRTGETLGAITARLQREWPTRRLRPFDTGTVRTTGGATVVVGIARAD